MIKGLLLSAAVFLSLYLLYNEFEPTIQEVVVRVDNKITRTPVDRRTAIKYLKVLGFGTLVFLLVRDAIAAFRIALRSSQKPPSSEDEIGPRLREEQKRRRKAMSAANPEDQRRS